MWIKELAACARVYSSGVLTIVEPSAYPVSVRCKVVLNDAAEAITFSERPAMADGWRGKACLLFHRHNDVLEEFHELVIKGELVEENGQLTMRSCDFITGTGRLDTDAMPHAAAPMQLIRFMLLGRRKAREYLAKRGKPWPPIDFDRLVQAAKEVE